MPGLLLQWASEEFELLPQRALFWKREGMLIAADLHLGKPAAFRASGLPVPGGTTGSTLEALSTIIEACTATRLLILGDLLHARAGRNQATFHTVAEWRARHTSLEIALVRGNHDESAGDPPSEWGIECCDGPLTIRDIAMVHDPSRAPRRAAHFIAAHVHPVFSLHDDDGTSLRLPCFCFGVRRALLPAFGAFTGGGRWDIKHGDRVFLAGDGHVLEAPLPLLLGSK